MTSPHLAPRVIALGAIALLALAAPARAPEIPLEYEDARVYLPVTIGSATRWFILDTGVQPGDQIVAVNGRGTATLRLSGVRTLFSSPAGARLTLTMRRGDRQVESLITLARRL